MGGGDEQAGRGRRVVARRGVTDEVRRTGNERPSRNRSRLIRSGTTCMGMVGQEEGSDPSLFTLGLLLSRL